jgi:hypothetical protein
MNYLQKENRYVFTNKYSYLEKASRHREVD